MERNEGEVVRRIERKEGEAASRRQLLWCRSTGDFEHSD
jgi:hypothetical protein